MMVKSTGDIINDCQMSSKACFFCFKKKNI